MTPEAEAVRKVYRQHRQVIHPKYVVHDRWDACWEKAAEFVASQGLDLHRFIAAQFDQKKPFPEPNQLYSEHALKRYSAYKDTVKPEEELARRIEFELRFLDTRSRMGFSLEEVLNLPGAPLTPLFRYYACLMLRNFELARSFEPAAAEFGLARTDADKMYRQILLGEDVC